MTNKIEPKKEEKEVKDEAVVPHNHQKTIDNISEGGSYTIDKNNKLTKEQSNA